MTDKHTDKPKVKAPKAVAIKNIMPAGRLFSSVGVIPAGECVELPKDEAKRFVETGKAEIVFPE